MPMISTHQNTTLPSPRANGNYQGHYDMPLSSHNYHQQRAMQHSILNFSMNQHHLATPPMKTPPPAHFQPRPPEMPDRVRIPSSQIPTPTNGALPPPSNHGGIIRAPTVAVRPHCPWCQQVANWEQTARALSEEWKKIKGMMENAKFNADKLRDHGCPPPPPHGCPPPQP